MASTFKEIIGSKDFVDAYGFNNRGICFVEDETDIDFWERLIEKHLPSRFDVKPASSTKNPHARGKKALCERIPYLNSKHIIAIDSDYDYIVKTPNTSKFDNKYILQTFFYSRESIIYRSDRLDDIIKPIKYNIPHDLKVSDLLCNLSKRCYDVLIYIAYLIEKNHIEYSVLKSTVNKIINVSSKRNLIDKEVCFNENFLDPIDDKLKVFISKYQDFISNEDIESFKSDKLALGLSIDSAYQYIDGHLLENYVNSFFDATIKSLIAKESIRICNDSKNIEPENKSIHIESQINKMEKHFEGKCSYTTLISTTIYEDYSHTDYKRIVEKILSIDK